VSKNQELLTQFLIEICVLFFVEKCHENFKNAASSHPQALRGRGGGQFRAVFRVFCIDFQDEKWIFQIWKMRKQLTFFAIVFFG